MIEHREHVVGVHALRHVHLHGRHLAHRLRRHDRLVGGRGDRRVLIVLDQDAVGRGPPIGELVVAGVDRLVVRPFGIDVGHDHAVTLVGHLGDDAALGIHDHAAAGIIDRALVAGLGCGHQPDAVFVGTCRAPHVGLVHGKEVRHVHDDLGALQREAARDLGNASVETDQEPDAPEVGVDDGASAFAEREPVLVVGGEKLLVVVDRDLALAIEHDAGIEDPLGGPDPTR